MRVNLFNERVTKDVIKENTIKFLDSLEILNNFEPGTNQVVIPVPLPKNIVKPKGGRELTEDEKKILAPVIAEEQQIARSLMSDFHFVVACNNDLVKEDKIKPGDYIILKEFQGPYSQLILNNIFFACFEWWQVAGRIKGETVSDVNKYNPN